MRAIRVTTSGGPEVLTLDDISRPEPKAGEALVAIEAIGLNFIETYVRAGLYKAAMPLTLGTEAAGTVVAVGPDVTTVKEGDRVASTSFVGAYAEFAVAPAERLVVLPEGVSTRLGAAVMLQGMTAHYLATSTCPLLAGDTCLIHAAAGGVGLLLCQIAKKRGARVIGTVSTETKATLARGAGADEVILYTQEDFVLTVRRLTFGKGVRVIYDSVGKTTFEKGLDALAPRGLMALFGQSSGLPSPVDPQLLNQKGSLFLTRPKLGDYIATREELLARSGDILNWVRDGDLNVRIDREFALEASADAHRALEGRETTGKVLLIP